MRFPAQVEQLHPIILWMRKTLSCLSLEPSVLKKMELALEEALVNIIHHAYKNKGGDVDLTIATSPHQVTLVIKDQGPPFNPLTAETKFDPTLSLEERELGGLGIQMMRQFMDEVRYKRDGSQNVLTLIKKY